MVDKVRILAGREAVDEYRAAHTELHSMPWHRGVPEEHTPLLDNLLVKLEGQGLNSLDEFFTTSEELNIQELGFEDKADFDSRATEADWEALKEMWH